MSDGLKIQLNTKDVEVVPTRKAKAMRSSKERTLYAVASIVMRDCDPFVPMDSGQLANSVWVASDPWKGNVIYDTPYAHEVYYGVNKTFSTDHHPQATAKWFDKAKAVHLKEWLKVGKEAYLKRGWT